MDGCSSTVRKWGGFHVHLDPSGKLFAGVLLKNAPASAENAICMLNPCRSRMVLHFPQTDWDAAGHAYAAEHDRYFDMVRTTNLWCAQIVLQPGPEADVLGARVLPQLEADRFFLPDTQVAGPDLAPATQEHRAKIFGLH